MNNNNNQTKTLLTKWFTKMKGVSNKREKLLYVIINMIMTTYKGSFTYDVVGRCITKKQLVCELQLGMKIVVKQATSALFSIER